MTVSASSNSHIPAAVKWRSCLKWFLPALGLLAFVLLAEPADAAPAGAPGPVQMANYMDCSGENIHTFWYEPSHGSAPITHYKVYYGNSGNPITNPTGVITVQYPQNSISVRPPWSPNHYSFRTTAVNQYGEGDPDNVGNYWGRLACDQSAPTISNGCGWWCNSNWVSYNWRNTYPTITGLTWQDGYSGLANNAQYSVGTSSWDTTSVRGLTNLPTQPSSGTVAAWTPSWLPATLRQGSNYITVNVNDRAGYQTSGTVYVDYDSVNPTVTGNVVTTGWVYYNPYLSGVCYNDATSGIAAATYFMGSSPGASNYLASTALPDQPWGAPTSWCPSFYASEAALRQGNNYVTVVVRDQANNGLTASSYNIKYDSVQPTSTGGPVTKAWSTTNPSLSGVCFADGGSGLSTGVTYRIGSSAGGSDYLGSTALPIQPVLGQASWCPTFTVSSAALRQGLNYVTVTVSDQAGQGIDVPAYVIRYDTMIPVASNAPATVWGNANPMMSGVCFTDSASGLVASSTYWVGSTAGASDYLASTTMPTQPAAGQTSAWCPSFTMAASAFRQGTNYVTIRTVDQLGNALTTQAYVVRYDAVAPTASGAPATLPWQNSGLVSGVCFTDPLAGLAATATYWVGSAAGGTNHLASTALPVQPPQGQTGQWCPSFAVAPSALRLGNNHVTIRVADQAGNAVTTQSYLFQYDNLAPTPGAIEWAGGAAAPAWTSNTNPTFTWDPQDTGGSGLVGGAQGSQHLLDGSGDGYTSHASAAYTDVADGVHTFMVNVQDTATNQASATYTFQVDTAVPTLARPVALTAPGPLGWYNADVALRIDSADALSGVQCEKHGLSPTSLTTSDCAADTWTDSVEGTQTYFGQATDMAGNVFNDPTTLTVKLDKSPPTLTDNQPDVPWTSVNPALQVTFGDSVSGIQKLEYAVYAGANQTGALLKPWTAFFSTNADGFTNHVAPWSADSGSFQQGENHVVARVTDRAGNTVVTEVAQIDWDNTAPSRATPTVDAGIMPSNGWYTIPVGMTIDSADVTSGVKCEQHSNSATPLWSGLPCPEQDAWTDGSEGTETWYGRAEDQAGNGFTSGGVPIAVDTVDPASGHALFGTMGTGGWYTTDVVATVQATDATSGVATLHTRLDADAWASNAVPSLNVQVNGDGIHVLSYFATDAATNSDGSQAAPKAVTVRVDQTAPSSGIALAGTQGLSGWYTSDVTATVTASDATSGLFRLWYKVDNGAWVSTTQPSVNLSFTTPGLHSVSAYAIDAAGNQDGSAGSPKVTAFGVDKVNPATTDSVSGPRGRGSFYIGPVTVTLAATDATSGVLETRYGIGDPAAPTEYTGAFPIAAEGDSVVHYRSRDQAGNWGAMASRVVSIDSLAPEVAGWAQSPLNVDASTLGGVTVTVAVDPGTSGLLWADARYSYDSGVTWSPWASTAAGTGTGRLFTIPEPSGGWWTHKGEALLYEVRASDNAGNQVTVQRSDLVQRVAPTVTLQDPSWGPTWGQSLRTIRWTGQDLDHDSVSYTVRLSPDGGATFPKLLYSTTVAEDGAANAYQYTWDSSQEATGANYVIRVQAGDGQATASAAGSFRIDNTIPEAVLVSPALGNLYVENVAIAGNPLGTQVAGTKVTLKASAHDPGLVSTGVAAVRFYVDGNLLSTVTAPAASGYYETTWTLTGVMGKHTVGVRSQDGLGHLSPMATRQVTVVQDIVTV